MDTSHDLLLRSGTRLGTTPTMKMPATTVEAKTSASPSPAQLGRPPPALPNEILLIAESHWLFTEQDLHFTPSVVAGLSTIQERENRAKGVNFILQVGIMLKLPQITLATASVFLHRFFMRYPMVEDKVTLRPHHHYYSVAATCLFLATKVEENCRKMKELVIACVRVAQKNPVKVVDEQDKEFWRWRDTVLQLEDLLLEALCFDLSLEPTYKTLFAYLVYFGEENNKPLRNAAWAFVNDSCLTPLCLLWSSRTIAASALYAAARHCGVKFLDDKDGRAWWEVIGVELKNMRKACNFMAAVYENTPLRGGTEETMYLRTPEDGDEEVAKTRQRRLPTELGSQSMERTASNVSITESDISRKRGRDEVDGTSDAEDIPWGGVTREERERENKKLKINEFNGAPQADEENNANGEKAAASNGEPGSLVSPRIQEHSGSEEGEVEED